MSTTLTTKQLRQTIMDVVQQIVSDWTAYPLAVETTNRDLIDQPAQVNPYLQVSVVPMMGGQAELGPNPFNRYDGQIQLAVVVKDGAGVADAEDLMDFVLPYFSNKQFGIVQCQAAYPVRGRPVAGLWYQPAIVPYYFFSKSA